MTTSPYSLDLRERITMSSSSICGFSFTYLIRSMVWLYFSGQLVYDNINRKEE